MTVQFATKPRLAEQMIAAALDAGIAASWVTGEKPTARTPICGLPWRHTASAT